MSRHQITQAALRLAQDRDARLDGPAHAQAVDAALARYAEDRPRARTVEVTADGSITIPKPADWAEGRSAVVSLEYPIGEVPPTFLPAGSIYVVDTPAGQVLRCSRLPGAGAALLLTYTTGHVLTDTQDTTAAADAEALACYAAAVMCDMLAASYAGAGEPTIAADRTDQTSPAREYTARAKALRARYHALLGVDANAAGAASAVAEIELRGDHRFRPIPRW